MPTIEDRLQPEIKLISPNEDGNKEYIGKWIGDPVTKEKKLGLFDSPKVKGTLIQDLEVKGDLHQLTIYFDGPDHDLVSAEFWKSLDAKGKWAIFHPMRGLLNLNLSRAVWEDEPVRSVDFTTFNTNWIEGLPDGTEVSIVELKTTLDFQASEANLSAVRQLESNVKVDSFAQYRAIVGAVEKAVNTIKKNLKKIENLQIINPRIEALFRGIESTISNFPPDITALGAQFSGLFESIGLSQNNSISSIDNFTTFADNLAIEPDDAGDGGRNSAAILELNLSLVNAEIAKSVILPGIETREQAIEIATKVNDYFTSMINRLDEIQEFFYDTPIESQFVSQSGSYSDQLTANKLAIKFLLSSSVNLKIERRFKTKVPRAPIEIAWTELDGPGEITEVDGILLDENFANFCKWNNLHGDDIILLPAGTEVRVFI